MSNSLVFPATTPNRSNSNHPVRDTYHGVVVMDEHRWLEDGNDPAVRKWTDAQNRRTRNHLDAIESRAEVFAQLTALFAQVTPSYSGLVARPGGLFAFKFQPPKQQHLLVVLTLASAEDPISERILLDSNELEPKGHVAIDWFVPSPDGKRVAVCLSEYGSEEGTLHFYDTETGRVLPDRIPRVQYPTGSGTAAWEPDGMGVFYTRYPHPDDRPCEDHKFYQQIYRHRLGTPDTSDEYAVGGDFPRIAYTVLSTSPDGRWLLASVANGDGGEYAHWLLDMKQADPRAWHQITRFEDSIKEVSFGNDGSALYLRSVQGSPRGKILRLPADGSMALADAPVLLPEGDAVMEGLVATANHLYLTEIVGGPSRVRRFDLMGGNPRDLPIPAACGVMDLIALADHDADDRVLYRLTSHTEPDAWFLYDPAADGSAGCSVKTAMTNTSPVDLSDIEVLREFAVSKDGTRVPVNILRRKGTPLDGNSPTLLQGYGGYGYCMRPQFNCTLRLWFDRGGIYVMANLRGGGEYGTEWHLNGNLTRKQNVFDDFAACARHLIERGYTCPEKLAVEGRSNGGLLMGAFLTQHPELARAVVAHVGIYDMLRFELEPNGAFNTTEFGTVEEPEQFKAMHAYSPYHQVRDGTSYPAVLLLTGENDGRVSPANSRKMAARLQQANASANPILVQLSSAAGHGMGTALAERIAENADVLAFLINQLGMTQAPASDIDRSV
jgi:prolyl oligopeptidase